MPRRDGTGPEGKGPRTGRILGSCGNGISKVEKIPLRRNRRQSPLGLGRNRK